jgi:hypothetical protein
MKETTLKVLIPDDWELETKEITIGKSMAYDPSNPVVSYYPKVVICKPWKEPDFLKPGWIAMDRSRDWWWFESEPYRVGYVWQSTEGKQMELCGINWAHPPCHDWKETKRRIK